MQNRPQIFQDQAASRRMMVIFAAKRAESGVEFIDFTFFSPISFAGGFA
jgi:hypothetical protein